MKHRESPRDFNVTYHVPGVSPYFISKFFSIYRGFPLPTGFMAASHSVGCAMVNTAPEKAAAALDKNRAREEAAVVRGIMA